MIEVSNIGKKKAPRKRKRGPYNRRKYASEKSPERPNLTYGKISHLVLSYAMLRLHIGDEKKWFLTTEYSRFCNNRFDIKRANDACWVLVKSGALVTRPYVPQTEAERKAGGRRNQFAITESGQMRLAAAAKNERLSQEKKVRDRAKRDKRMGVVRPTPYTDDGDGVQTIVW